MVASAAMASVRNGEMSHHALAEKFHVKPVAATKTVIVRVHPAMEEEIRHSLLGSALKRIREFCAKFDTDANGKFLAKAVEQDFAKERDHEFYVLVAIRGSEIVGHLLAHLDFYYGGRIVFVMHLELDRRCRLTLEELKGALEDVAAWGQTWGAKKMGAAALTERHRRRLEKVFGFRLERYALGKEIG
jgi:hypothetical protein